MPGHGREQPVPRQETMLPLRLELPTGLAVGSVNSYLFTEPEPILVDTGVAGQASWEALVHALAQHGLSVADLSRVIITHPHVDHYGQAGKIAAHSDADIWICDLGAAWLQESTVRSARRDRFYSDYFLPGLGLPPAAAATIVRGLQGLGSLGGAIPGDRLHTFAADGLLQMGGRSWQVIHTPGHCSVQTCFYEAQAGTLLSADMLLATTPAPVVESPPDGSFNRVPALPRFMASLALLESMPIADVLPGHGRPFANHHDVIRRQRTRILARKQECLDWIEAGYHTVPDLVEQMYAHHAAAMRFAGLWMLVGYLDLLQEEHLVEERTIEGVWHYYAAGQA